MPMLQGPLVCSDWTHTNRSMNGTVKKSFNEKSYVFRSCARSHKACLETYFFNCQSANAGFVPFSYIFEGKENGAVVDEDNLHG